MSTTPDETPDEQLSEEYLITHLSHRPPHQLAGRISVSDPPKFSTLPPHSGPSSIGRLDVLPLEILHDTLNSLDFRTLSRLSYVSKRGRSVVESLPAYRELMKHAPDTLKALGKSQLINFHPAGRLRAVLRSESCVWCGQYGPFLFLPTLDRCCYECQRSNPSLWVMTTDLARYCFSLTTTQVRTLPIIRSIYGVYDVSHELSRRRRLKLVSVKAAKELSQSLPEPAVPVPPGRSRMPNLDHFQTAPLEPTRDKETGALVRAQYCSRTDECCGMASICFPSLQPDNSRENGLWCRGCYRASELYRFTYAIYRVVSFVNPPRALVGTNMCALSKREFLEHIEQCPGARDLLAALRRGMRN
ncbi:hypothetical protein MauCBS54593_000805 [Microsporum audouinii]